MTCLPDPSFSYVNEDEIDEELLCSHVCHAPLVDPIVARTRSVVNVSRS
jgi:hypothetical protein